MATFLISWSICGAVAAALSYLLSRRPATGGVPALLVIALLGAVAAGYLMAVEARIDVSNGPLTYGNLIGSFVGALLALWVWRTATRDDLSA